MSYSPLLTDFYQITMAYGYWKLGMHEREAVFHLFFRRNPCNGNYIVASGLKNIIDFLQAFQFSDDDLAYLSQQTPVCFPDEFLAYLNNLRFTGDMDAVPEGTVVFANEPILRIKAPLILCQLLETPIINLVNFSSAVASMASRIKNEAGDDLLFEFGLRRAQGPDGGLSASRAAFLGGFDATSNVLAGKKYNIPVVGTMAHSWVMAFEDEYTAFSKYAQVMSEDVVLLVDTYDTAHGVDNVIKLANSIKAAGGAVKGIRLDSGDLNQLSCLAREKLDQAGLVDVKIYVSGDLNAARIQELKSSGAPINGWGVGTYLTTAYDQPALDLVYKLGAISHGGKWSYKFKMSDNPAKSTDPGVLQVRRYFKNNSWVQDVVYDVSLGVEASSLSAKHYLDLLIPIFRSGECIYNAPSLSDSRLFCKDQVAQFLVSSTLQPYTIKKDAHLFQLKQNLLKSMNV